MNLKVTDYGLNHLSGEFGGLYFNDLAGCVKTDVSPMHHHLARFVLDGMCR